MSNKAPKLFGTDGIRGIAGKSPLSKKDVYYIGLAAGEVLRDHVKKGRPKILIARDTRLSGQWIEKMIAKGLQQKGIDVFSVGVISTPGAAHLVRSQKFHSGIVISASHNPPEFNGIKFFNASARKWPDVWEETVESLLFQWHKKPTPPLKSSKDKLIKVEQLREVYESFLIDTLEGIKLNGLKIALDCSNGASFLLAPRILGRLGADLHVIHARPNGRNINVGCGSQHTSDLEILVRKEHCHLGIAFDGDADRVIFVDEKGHSLDGDHIIAFLAGHLKESKALVKNKVVITVMANLGLKKALAAQKISCEEVSVGDRFVSMAMQKSGAILGGEQSGHIIMGQYLPTGDGLLTALQVLKYFKKTKLPFSHVSELIKKYPQVLMNLKVKKRVPLNELPAAHSCIKKIESELGSQGRVLVRYSGTEPLLRIMIEGPDKMQLHRYGSEITEKIEEAMKVYA
ncbi:MAG: phosphoglucosamine mutase [Elusimicrobiota bacterium]